MDERRAPGYPVPAHSWNSEITVQRSRFLATLDRASSPQRARAMIDQVRHEYPTATHHCWAFQAGPPRTSGIVGSSDDGEPHGTAGRPILEVLLHTPIGEVVAVVSRWYGGVKLGKGGLARAYSEVVAQAAASVPTALRTELRTLSLEFGYGDLEAMRKVGEDHFGRAHDETYGEIVRYRMTLPTALVDSFLRAAAAATAGRATVGYIDNEEEGV